eukprot:TRINITY_DN51228_c0_g1_i1.p1 TRINITY_DN51228_c0_g1~~TRINITY_DN51228_c0_g1_i1.p1  ORF type:complete len:466 (-),score=95.12 TRINITY_DN51228_c0_g1_i1:37-1434(-)
MVAARKRLREEAEAATADVTLADSTSKKKRKKAVPEIAAAPETGTVASAHETAAPKGKSRNARKRAAARNKSLDAPAPKGKSRNERKRLAKEAAKALNKTLAEEVSNGSLTNKVSGEDLTVILGGFPYTVTADMLSKDFRKCGKIRKLNMPKDATGNAKGFAFITFTTKDGVDAALKFNGKDYRGRQLSARLASTKIESKQHVKDGGTENGPHELVIFVAGLPRETGAHEIRTYFSKAGAIKSLKLPRNNAGRPKGFAFITYHDQAAVKKALRCNGDDFEGCSLTVRMSGDADGSEDGGDKRKDGEAKGTGKGQSKSRGDPELTVFVSGFPYFTKEKRLRKTFAPCGDIATFKLPMCEWDESQSRGFAFISFKDKTALQKALELDGKEIDDRYISVKMAGDMSSTGTKKVKKQRSKDEAGAWSNAQTEDQVLTREDLKSDRERGILVKPTGKKVVFGSDEEDDHE